MKPVEQFYPVRFADDDTLRAWAARVLDFATTRQGIAAGLVEPRPVVFVPLAPPDRGPVVGYVSDAARGLALGFERDVELDGTSIALRELPDGLTLLYGIGADAAAYERRLFAEPG